MYRWLLLAYPREYRRERGTEILETLRDVTPQRRAPRVAANLVRHGLRARLGRPNSRSVVVWASIFAVACGLFAASFGTWLAWLGSRPLDHRDLSAAVDQLYPAEPGYRVDSHNPPAVFVIYGSPLGRRSASSVLLGDGGEFSFAEVHAHFDHLPAGTRSDTLTQLQQRLMAAGWDFSKPIYTKAYGCVRQDSRCDPTSIPSNITVYARRGDNIIEMNINADEMTPPMNVVMSRATPWTVYPAGIAAFLFGALGGWSLFGWVSRRSEHGRAVAQALAMFMFGFVMFLWWAPIALSSSFLLEHHLTEPHYRWHPLWEWLGQPAMSLPFLFGVVVLILATGVALQSRRRPMDQVVARGSADREAGLGQAATIQQRVE